MWRPCAVGTRIIRPPVWSRVVFENCELSIFGTIKVMCVSCFMTRDSAPTGRMTRPCWSGLPGTRHRSRLTFRVSPGTKPSFFFHKIGFSSWCTNFSSRRPSHFPIPLLLLSFCQICDLGCGMLRRSDVGGVEPGNTAWRFAR